MNRRVIIFIINLIVLIGIGYIGIQLWQGYQAGQDIKNGASNQELLATIIRTKPSLTYNRTPFIEVAGVKRIDDIWYIVTIKSVHDDDIQVPVKILIRDQRTDSKKRNLAVLLGPEAHFTAYQLIKSDLPDSVTKELQK